MTLLPRLGFFFGLSISNQWRNHIGSSHGVIQFFIQGFSLHEIIFMKAGAFLQARSYKVWLSPRMGLPAMPSNCDFSGKKEVQTNVVKCKARLTVFDYPFHQAFHCFNHINLSNDDRGHDLPNPQRVLGLANGPAS